MLRVGYRTLVCIISVCASLMHAIEAQAVFETNEEFECRSISQTFGGSFKPNCKSRWKRFSKNKLLFDILFMTDEYGRRITPIIDPGHREDLALFFGCSFTLGAGVNGDQTTPYYFSQTARSFNVYNYGGSAYGPQQMLAALQRLNIKSQVKLGRGRRVAVYYFLPFHVQRAVGKPSIYHCCAKYFPYYDLDDSNNLVYKGTFKSGKPILSKIFELINTVPFLEYWFERWTEEASDRDILITARIIKEAAELFKRQFESDEFYVMLGPGHGDRIYKNLKELLNEYRITYFDYSSLVETLEPSMRVGDGHPSAQAHRIIGSTLAQEVQKIAGSRIPEKNNPAQHVLRRAKQ